MEYLIYTYMGIIGGPNTINTDLQFIVDGANLKSSFQTDTRSAKFVLANDEYLSCPANDLVVGNEDFSFGCWVKPTSAVAAVSGGVMGIWNGPGSSESYLLFLDGNADWQFLMSHNGSTDVGIIHSLNTVVDTWYFIVCVYDATADEMRMYIDDNTVETFSNANGAYGSSTTDFRIGSYLFSGTEFTWDGCIDNAFFYNKALSQGEVDTLYNSGNGTNYTNADKTNLISWWNLNENGETRKDSHGSNDLTDNNTVGFDTGKVSEGDFFYSRNMIDNADGQLQNGVELVDGAMEFDGVNDYVDFGSIFNGVMDGSNALFSVDFWYYKADSSLNSIIGKIDLTPSDFDFLIWELSGAIRMGKNGGTFLTGSGGLVPIGQWSHVVCTYDGSGVNYDAKIYINSVFDVGNSALSNMASNNRPLVIGKTSGGVSGMTGKMAHLRIYDRIMTASEISQNYTNLAPRFLS